MAQVKIFMLGLDDERCLQDTVFVTSTDIREVTEVMIRCRMDPDGWSNGMAYEADIDPDISHTKAMTLEEFKEYLQGGEKTSLARSTLRISYLKTTRPEHSGRFYMENIFLYLLDSRLRGNDEKEGG